MAFKNLEARFNENVNKLYAGATLKFEGGKASNGRNDDPLIVRKPGAGQVGIKLEGRSLPVVSTIQDVKRLTLFNLSTRGLLFLAKQQLLQTGNTFEFTRALNPAFVVANAVPFLHIKRNLRPLGELVGKTDTSFANVKSMGQLQNSTYNKLKSKGLELPFGKAIDFNRPGAGKALTNKLLGPLKALKDTVKNTLSAFSPNQKRNIGELIDKWGVESWKVSRPELDGYINGIQSANRKYQSTIDKSFVTYFDVPTGEDAGGIRSLSDAILGKPDKNNVITDPDSFEFKRWERLTKVAYGGTRTSARKISYIKDPANAPNNIETVNSREAYKPINSDFTDPIVVSFAMGKDDAVQFRAFIKDLNQTATPEYKAYQYIGRIEKFINYVGVQREISFKLGVVAFSRDELNVVWRRINYLTGLVFPYGFNKGIMQPNITRLTIGDVYVNQPGYVTSLSTNFTELSESWELDAGSQVPIAAQMDIKFTLIEKASRIADSPFYGITDGGTSGSPMSGFKNSLTPQKPKDVPVDANKDAPEGDRPLDFRAERKKYLAGVPEYVPIAVDKPTITIRPPNITFGR